MSLYAIIQGNDIKFIKFFQIKNDVQVYHSVADLLPNHAKVDIYFCKQCLAHAWTYLADCIQVGLYVA